MRILILFAIVSAGLLSSTAYANAIDKDKVQIESDKHVLAKDRDELEAASKKLQHDRDKMAADERQLDNDKKAAAPAKAHFWDKKPATPANQQQAAPQQRLANPNQAQPQAPGQ